MTPSKTQPALLGGLAIGVLSALPVINLANCCCAWILFGGALAAYLTQQNHPEPIGAGDGAAAGLMAGAVGAFVWAAISLTIHTALAILFPTIILLIIPLNYFIYNKIVWKTQYLKKSKPAEILTK